MPKLAGYFLDCLSAFSIFRFRPDRPPKHYPRRSMAFFPFLGILCGFLLYLWIILCLYWQFSPGFFAAVAIVIPVVFTRGLHYRGFARLLYGFVHRRDHTAGQSWRLTPTLDAFSSLWVMLFLFVCYGSWQALYAYPNTILISCFSFVLSRATCALFPLVLRMVRLKNPIKAFLREKHRLLSCMLLLWWVLTALYMLITAWQAGLAVILANLLVLLFYLLCKNRLPVSRYVWFHGGLVLCEGLSLFLMALMCGLT